MNPSRRLVVQGIGALLVPVTARPANAQRFRIPTHDDLVQIFKEDRGAHLLVLDVNFLRSTLLRILFVRLGAKSLDDFSQHAPDKNWDKNSVAYNMRIREFLNPQSIAKVRDLLTSGDAKKIVEETGKQCVDSATKIEATIRQQEINAGSPLVQGAIRSLIAFAQVDAVWQLASARTPIYCRYFPFSYFCGNA